MSMDPEQVRNIAKKYIQGTASAEEISLLHKWYDSTNHDDTEIVLSSNALDAEAFGEAALRELQQMIADQKHVSNELVAPVKRLYWWRMIAAAIFLLASGAGIYLLFKQTPVSPPIAVIESPQQVKDVAAPVGSKAVLTLAHGQKVVLEEAADGELAVQGSTKIVKKAGNRLDYTTTGPVSQVEFNTLTVPKGSNTATIMLEDGSRVWLNVASSITFPTAFTGKERKVTITGEVYFEVAKKEGMSFMVQRANDDTKVEVLGTHFNVNAYDDESAVKVSLLEGSVKVSKGGSAPTIIKPGQQAIINSDVTVINDVDMEEVMSWKNGFFKFRKTDIKAMMRQAQRWYDIQVDYPNGIPSDLFSGGISRNVNLSEFVKILEYSDVRTTISDKVVTINP